MMYCQNISVKKSKKTKDLKLHCSQTNQGSIMQINSCNNDIGLDHYLKARDEKLRDLFLEKSRNSLNCNPFRELNLAELKKLLDSYGSLDKDTQAYFKEAVKNKLLGR